MACLSEMALEDVEAVVEEQLCAGVWVLALIELVPPECEGGEGLCECAIVPPVRKPLQPV